MKRDTTEAKITAASFTIQWGGETCEQKNIIPTEGISEIVKLYLARETFLDVLNKGVVRRDRERRALMGVLVRKEKITRARFLDVLKKGAKRARSHDTAEAFAKFLFGG